MATGAGQQRPTSVCRILRRRGFSPTRAVAPLPVDTALVSVLVRMLVAGGGGAIVLLGGGDTLELPAASERPM